MSEEYKCGHKTNGVIILNSNELSICDYENWSDSVGVFGTKELCWDCWCKNKRVGR